MQWGTLTREVPLLRVLWVWTSHRQKHWDYSWDLAAAGTRYMGKVFSNRKTVWILWVRTAACLKDPPGQTTSRIRFHR